MNCLGAGLLALITCLGDPDPNIRDKHAFERLAAAMRAGEVDRDTLASMESQLLQLVAGPDPQGFQRPFAILTLAEIARTDRVKPWMTEGERNVLVNTAANFLSSVTDYRSFDDQSGFRHAVAHGADFALQLALNAAITKPQLDRLLAAIATQVAPDDPSVAYWAGEPDRLARAVIFIAQRRLHTDAEWKAWFDRVLNPRPLTSWDAAFASERGIRKHHNVRAFLLSVYANAATSDDAGIRQLAAPARDSLKLVP
ncbi:MAG TPA: DUF2785 domain-containing protein [Vicinamibacterales bacterium]|nr:DUF2785 domain-containing protein [Vicinamibacterales bacterium]